MHCVSVILFRLRQQPSSGGTPKLDCYPDYYACVCIHQPFDTVVFILNFSEAHYDWMMGVSTSLAIKPRENSSSFGGHRPHQDLEDDYDSTFSASGNSDVLLSSSSSPQAWAVIRSETLVTWKYAAVLWGFDPRIDYTSNVKARLQPWCTAGRHLIVRHDPPTRLVLQRPHCVLTIVEGCFRQDTFVRLPSSYATRLHIEPDPAGHYLKCAQVSEQLSPYVGCFKISNCVMSA